MTNTSPVLFMICGKIASGKSTLAQKLSASPQTILISEDQWLSSLFANELTDLKDYIEYSARLRSVMGPHIRELLSEGLSVVLDYPANTIKNRNWMRSLFEGVGASHQLHLLNVPDAICKGRLKERNKSGAHQFQPSEEDYDIISSYFETPTNEEGFNITVHDVDIK